ncbi:MAG: hypothetical protein ACXABY_13410 [Candidatus Thorarchaeota archaeon]|jgi:replicative superfamily II helicase
MSSELQIVDEHDLVARGLQQALEKSPNKVLETLLKNYLLALSDPELLAYKRDIALFEARRSELIMRSTTGDSDQWRKDLRRSIKELEKAVGTGDILSIDFSMKTHKELVQKGYIDTVIWGEIEKLVRTMKHLRSAELKRRRESELSMTREEVLELMTKVAKAIDSHVQDKRVLEAISYDLMKLLEPVSVVEGEMV